MRHSHKLAIISVLLSASVLVACSHQDSQAKAHFATSKTSQSSSVTKKSATKKQNKKQKSKTTTKQSNNDKSIVETQNNSMPAQSSSVSQALAGNNTSAEVSTPQQPASTSSINVNALASGDFSTIAGTWADDKGNVITVSSDGRVTWSSDESSDVVQLNQVSGGSYFGFVGGGAFIVIPGGVASPHFGDTSPADRLVIGQSAQADDHPFFRS